MNIYIACSLTHVPREHFERHVEFIQKIAGLLSEEFGANIKYALKDSDPQLAEEVFETQARLCYLWDRNMVENADLIIAEASYPSTGLGIELQIAEHKKIPVILLFRDQAECKAPPVEYTDINGKHSLQIGEGYISLMALGMPNVSNVFSYTTQEDAFHAIRQYLTTN
ncbi:hypothetical protein [Zymobacter sp. IVIA_5232.4 C2]|uniref:hypothetical protein n=1 Tax=Zymobacter sp. IVIA_5232.4 C2 TaxID=3394855 RepID=UPI0039C35CE5